MVRGPNDEVNEHEQTDWYGAKAKRKNDDPAHPSRHERMWYVISTIITALIILGGCGLITLVLFPTLLSTPKVPQAVVVVTATPTFTPSPVPMTLQPTTAPPSLTPVPKLTEGAQPTQPLTRMIVNVYYPDMRFGYTMPMLQSLPGYLLRGMRALPSGPGFAVAHTRGLGAVPCDDNEAYWVWNVEANRIIKVGDARMVSPKAFAANRDYKLILATDCVDLVNALFLFDGENKLVDTFPVIGGDALISLPNGHFVLSLSGFAGGNQQDHFLELAITGGAGNGTPQPTGQPTQQPKPPKIEQVDQFGADNSASIYPALLVLADNQVIGIRDNAHDYRIGKVDALTTVYASAISSPIYDLSRNTHFGVIGLDRINRQIVVFRPDLTLLETHLTTGIQPYSMTVENGTDAILISGYPMDEQGTPAP